MNNYKLKKAFTEHKHGSQSDHSHTDGVYKGLGAVVGIYMFFLIERIMQIRRARKEKRVCIFQTDLIWLKCNHFFKQKSEFFWVI